MNISRRNARMGWIPIPSYVEADLATIHDRIKAAGKWPEGQITMGPEETLAILKAMYPQHVAKDVDA